MIREAKRRSTEDAYVRKFYVGIGDWTACDEKKLARAEYLTM